MENRTRAILALALQWAELWAGLLVVAVATLCGVGMAWHAALVIRTSWISGNGSFAVRSIILGTMNVLILFELAQMFLALGNDHKVHIRTMVDTAILFSMREVILKVYGDLPGVIMAAGVAGIFMFFRVVLLFTKRLDQKV